MGEPKGIAAGQDYDGANKPPGLYDLSSFSSSLFTHYVNSRAVVSENKECTFRSIRLECERQSPVDIGQQRSEGIRFCAWKVIDTHADVYFCVKDGSSRLYSCLY